jgi:hypothetical protein
LRDRYAFRKSGDADDERLRDGRGSNLRVKRSEGDQDSEGWSTVKPRKSFGTEGAERFNGRMGGDRHKDDRRFRDREDRERDRPARGFDSYSRDKDGDQEQEGGRRNGVGRARNEPWFKDSHETPSSAGDRRSNGDRFGDRARAWRDKDRDEKAADRVDDRGDRRWDRDRRQERDPEWMDEPADEKQAHTAEDFQKWKESMKASSGATIAEGPQPKPEPSENGPGSFFGLEKPKVETPLIVDTGPDKFLGTWGALGKQDGGIDTPLGVKVDGIGKSSTAGKSSRFTSFFAPKEETQRRQTEPTVALSGLSQQENNPEAEKEKLDFQRLLEKLHGQNLSNPSPLANIGSQSKPPQEHHSTAPQPLQDSYQLYRTERQELQRPTTRDSQQALQELLGQRQGTVSQPPSRPEQMLQDLVSQRQNTLSQSSGRPDPAQSRNTEFLMGLMGNNRAMPEPLRTEQMMIGVRPQQQPDRLMQQMSDREQEILREQRERSVPQRQRRPDVPPGFYDEISFQRGDQIEANPRSQAPMQPTQILQRPPPGLDQLPLGWNAQLPPPMSQRHIAPPPGLPGGPNRGIPMQQNMFPPGFPIGGGMGGFGLPPDNMVGGGLRNIPPPPPGFMIQPPGFMGGPPMNVFPGPEGMAYGPFEGRGAPPQGNYRR